MKNVKVLSKSQIFFDDVLTEEIPEFIRQLFTSDENNNVLSEIVFNEEGEEVSKVLREYDDDNRLRKETKEAKDVDKEVSTFFYDGKFLIEEIHEFGDDYKERLVYKYDAEGHQIERIFFGMDDMILERKIITYKNGLPVKIEIDEDDEIELETESFYDDNGNLIEEIYYTLEGKETTTNYTYDEKNRLVKTIAYNEFGGISHIEENFYDEKNRIIKTITKTHDDTITFVYEYNEYDQITYFSYSNINGILLHENKREYEDNILKSSESLSFNPNLNKKEITELTYVTENF